MRDSQHGNQGERESDELSVLARTVVARLARGSGRARRMPDATLVASMCRAVSSDDPAAYEALRPDIRRARISDGDLVDLYFPAVARQLGCNWAEDRAGFAEVSIGMARLQALVHQIGREWASNAAATPDSSVVLVVLPEGEQHSFGVQVLTGQLRRHGVSVHLQIGARPAALRALVQERRYDCAMVSVACEEKLAFCRSVVAALKHGSNGRLWVAVGGAVLERDLNVRALTGADMATNDALLAISAAKGRAIQVGAGQVGARQVAAGQVAVGQVGTRRLGPRSAGVGLPVPGQMEETKAGLSAARERLDEA
jgi:MerR family transcriptional regulator, light-induced transcriptional regulator